MTKILLVEDDQTLGSTLTERLEEEGYSTRWVTTRSDAEAAFSEDRFDLVILDIGLPDGKGFAFGRHVKEHSGIPLVFLTAMVSAEYRLEGFEIGADDYIPKPFHLKELLLRISRVLETRGIKRTIEVGDIVIELESMSIRLPGGEIEQPQSRDFELLCYLVQSAPRVLSRESIHQKLWATDPDTSSFRSIDNSVLRLRTIFRKVSEDEFIRSVRSVGYQWVYGRE